MTPRPMAPTPSAFPTAPPPDNRRQVPSPRCVTISERCDNRQIAPETHLLLSAADRLTRDDILTALPLCINIIRIGTTLVLPNGEQFGRDDINSSLSVRLVLALATLDETSRARDAV